MPTAASSTEVRRAIAATSRHLVGRSAPRPSAGRAPSRWAPRSSSASPLAAAALPALLDGRRHSTAATPSTLLLLMPTAMAGVPAPGDRLGGRLGRWPRAAPPRARRHLPGQPDHRPPRRPAARAAQHRLAAAGLDPAGHHGVRRRAAARCWSAEIGDRPLAGRRHRDRRRSWPGRWRRSAAARTASRSIRSLGVALAAAAVMLQLTDHTIGAPRRAPDRAGSSSGYVDGFGWRWVESSPSSWRCSWSPSCSARSRRTSRLAGCRATSCGSRPASYLARRLPRSAARHAGAHRPGSVWRSVPMRRGLAGAGHRPRPRGARRQPGLAADDDPARAWSPPVARCCSASTPGASTAAARSGARACRSARRPSSPPGRWVLTEFLLVASLVTMVLAGACGPGCPSAAELTALLCTWVVVVLQVVTPRPCAGRSRRPFAVDLRSARATPAPPLVMVGYSTKLAVTTTLTSLVFSGLARVPHPEVSVLVAAPFVVWSLVRLLHARDSWTDPGPTGQSSDDGCGIRAFYSGR